MLGNYVEIHKVLGKCKNMIWKLECRSEIAVLYNNTEQNV